MAVKNTKTFHGELVTFKEDNGYITYVFKNLDDCDIFHKYLMCVRFPRWECQSINIGDKGYIQYKEVIAGIDKWFDSELNQFIPYKYTDIHFLDFISEKKQQDEIKL